MIGDAARELERQPAALEKLQRLVGVSVKRLEIFLAFFAAGEKAGVAQDIVLVVFIPFGTREVIVADPDQPRELRGAAADLVVFLEHERTQALFMCGECSGKPGHAGADNDDVIGIRGHVISPRQPARASFDKRMNAKSIEQVRMSGGNNMAGREIL